MKKRRGSFLRSKILIAFSIVLLFGAGFLVIRERSSNQKTALTSQASINKKNAQAAIARGEKYLLNTFAQITPIQRLVLDFLHRKFNIDPKFSATTTPITQSENEQGTFIEFQAWRRIAYPDSLLSTLPKTDAGSISNVTVQAANCDHIPLPSNFDETLQQNAAKGTYYLTHTALSLKFMEENGCEISNKSQQLKETVATDMVELINDPKTVADLRYEAIALLMYMGHRNLVKDVWIEQILTEQQNDGGWRQDLTVTSESNDHSSVLALWALLEFTQPGATKEPMIRHAQ